jgi:hypothetical protein
MPNPQTFGLKQLRFTFTLNTNARFADGSNTLQLFGLRATADIDYPGPPSFPSMVARIYGMAQSDMNALTGLTFQVLSYNNNSVLVEANAGNGQGWNTVFAGQLVTVVPDYNSMPDVALSIYAQTLGYELLNPDTPTSYAQPAAFVDVITTIAAKMGKTVQNQGVSGSFAGPVYFAGTPAQQLMKACDKAGVTPYLAAAGLEGGSITIAPTGVALGSPAVLLTPTTGLIGYPTLDSVNLIGVRAFFNPALQYGGKIQIANSDQVASNGIWTIFAARHRLSSLMPNGPWFTEMTAQPPSGFVAEPP